MGSQLKKSLYGFEVRIPDKRRSENRKTHNLHSLWQRSHEILALALQGHKQVDIARILGITDTTVSNTINSELGQKKLSAMREGRDAGFIALSEEILELTEKALKVYREIFEKDTIDYSIKLKAAGEVTMKIAGLEAPTKVNTSNFNVTATPQEIAEFKSRGIQAAKDAGLLTDAQEAEYSVIKETHDT